MGSGVNGALSDSQDANMALIKAVIGYYSYDVKKKMKKVVFFRKIVYYANMFRSIVQNLVPSKQKNSAVNTSYARTHDRREEDMCVLSVNGNLHPVHNWSLGGAYIAADSHYFETDQDVQCILQLKTRNTIKRIALDAAVIRKDETGVALAFQQPNEIAQTQMLEYIEKSMHAA